MSLVLSHRDAKEMSSLRSLLEAFQSCSGSALDDVAEVLADKGGSESLIEILTDFIALNHCASDDSWHGETMSAVARNNGMLMTKKQYAAFSVGRTIGRPNRRMNDLKESNVVLRKKIVHQELLIRTLRDRMRATLKLVI